MAPSRSSPVSDPPEPAASSALLRALAANPERMAHLIDALHRPVHDATTLLDLMSRAAREAVELIPDVHWAGVTAQFEDDPLTTAHTDQRVLLVDDGQYEQGDGPCLQAMRTDRRVAMTIEEVVSRWPALAVAATRAGVVSFLAMPLHAHHQPSGSLNLYSGRLGGLRDPDPDLLIVLTEYLGRGLSDYADTLPIHAQVTTIRSALAERARLDHAIGILMALQEVDQDQAWDLIHQRSEAQGLSAADYCAALIAANTPPPR